MVLWEFIAGARSLSPEKEAEVVDGVGCGVPRGGW